MDVGNACGWNLDKFQAFGLTPLLGRQVTAQLLAECFANLEYKVIDDRLVDKFNLFILEVAWVWADKSQPLAKTLHHREYGQFAVDSEFIKLASKMR